MGLPQVDLCLTFVWILTSGALLHIEQDDHPTVAVARGRCHPQLPHNPSPHALPKLKANTAASFQRRTVVAAVRSTNLKDDKNVLGLAETTLAIFEKKKKKVGSKKMLVAFVQFLGLNCRETLRGTGDFLTHSTTIRSKEEQVAVHLCSPMITPTARVKIPLMLVSNHRLHLFNSEWKGTRGRTWLQKIPRV